jgi:DNA (cytosine-5)-methyltransferase 1
MIFNFIDLFAGIGGFRIAFEKNNCKCVFSSEIDKYARETYYKNFNEYPSGDITRISTSEIPDFDILCAGFPCQPFSIAGKRLGFEDSRGTLFFEIARILKDKKPKAFILENVKGLVNHNNGKTLETIETILNDLGYKFSYKVMNALDYGIPQNRERWYCVGFLKELGISFENEKNATNFIFTFPHKKELQFYLEDVIEQTHIKGYEATQKALENIKIHLPNFLKKKGINNDKLIIANEIRPSRCSFRNDGISPCLTAKMGTGGNNIPVLVNFSRKLTEKECLRLMGFPENFKIYPNHHQSYKQIGNSVVVPIIEELANKMVELLRKVG